MKTIDLKAGDEIIIRNFGFSRSSATVDKINKICVVSSNTHSISSDNGSYIKVRLKDNSSSEFYLYDKDVFDLANKNSQVKYYRAKIAGLEKAIEEAKIELEFHEKYDSMEEYVADKLIAIMKTDDKNSLVAMLKTLKQTNFL